MDNPRGTLHDAELSRLVGEDEVQYMSNGRVKYFVAFAGLVTKVMCSADIVLAGSTADGSKVNMSDIDVMFCPRSIVLNENTFHYNIQFPCFFQVPLADADEQLRVYASEDGECLSGESLKEIPNKIFKQLTTLYKFVLMKDKLGSSKVGFSYAKDGMSSQHSADLVPAFRISGCPECVKIWGRRERQWPDADVVESIMASEFHAVSKMAPLNGDATKDFCLSFTVAENKLLASSSDRQLLCFRILKILKPTLQNLISRRIGPFYTHEECTTNDSEREALASDIITSYHLKTAFLLVSEKNESLFWTTKNISDCVVEVLVYFHTCLVSRHLPHYFIPSMNLFGGFSADALSLASKGFEQFFDRATDISQVLLDCIAKRADQEPCNVVCETAQSNESMTDILNLAVQILQHDEIEISELELASMIQIVHDLGQQFLFPLRIVNVEQPCCVISQDGTGKNSNLPCNLSDTICKDDVEKEHPGACATSKTSYDNEICYGDLFGNVHDFIFSPHPDDDNGQTGSQIRQDFLNTIISIIEFSKTGDNEQYERTSSLFSKLWELEKTLENNTDGDLRTLQRYICESILGVVEKREDEDHGKRAFKILRLLGTTVLRCVESEEAGAVDNLQNDSRETQNSSEEARVIYRRLTGTLESGDAQRNSNETRVVNGSLDAAENPDTRLPLNEMCVDLPTVAEPRNTHTSSDEGYSVGPFLRNMEPPNAKVSSNEYDNDSSCDSDDDQNDMFQTFFKNLKETIHDSTSNTDIDDNGSSNFLGFVADLFSTLNTPNVSGETRGKTSPENHTEHNGSRTSQQLFENVCNMSTKREMDVELD